MVILGIGQIGFCDNDGKLKKARSVRKALKREYMRSNSK